MSDAATAPPPDERRAATAPPLLARLSVAMFGMVMGIGGLANAWSLATVAFGVPAWIGALLLALATALFAVLVCVHLAKLLLQPAAVAEEFAHPVRSSFFPAISVAAIVLSVGLRVHAHAVAEGLWWFGAVLHFGLAVTLIRRWVLHAQDEAVLTPAWFIPVVGNILVPVGGVPLGHVEISWFFFSVGLVFWLAFFTIVLHRVLFVPAMSQRSMPTLFILLAPPSVGLAAYLAFTDGHAGPMADIFYSLALFIAILLATLWRHVAHGPFFMSWWAMTFPAGGWAGASLLYHLARPTPWTAAIAVVALCAATLIVGWITAHTVRHMASGAAFKEE